MEISIGLLLKNFREQECLNQSEMAALLGLSRVCYLHLEKGQAIPHISTLKKISKLISVDLNFLKNQANKDRLNWRN